MLSFIVPAYNEGRVIGPTLDAIHAAAAATGHAYEIIVVDDASTDDTREIARAKGACRVAAGCHLFCTRPAFDAAGGFDERLFATEELALSQALKRAGPVVILRETVRTSGRKLRTHSGWEILQVMAAFVRIGRAVTHSRDRLELWYGSRRVDPDGGF